MLTGLPNPHPSPIPIPLVRVPDIRLDAWAYRLLRSLQVNRSNDRLVHRPYYRPFSTLDQGHVHPPFLLGGDHHFEWRHPSHQYPLATVNFSINPLYQFASPRVIITNHLLFSCPSIQILYWDCPQHLPVAATELLFIQEEELDLGTAFFIADLEEFCQAYFLPISPYTPSFSAALNPDLPPDVNALLNTPPLAIYNPNTIPLVSQQ